jgi:hypothetical protein
MRAPPKGAAGAALAVCLLTPARGADEPLDRPPAMRSARPRPEPAMAPPRTAPEVTPLPDDAAYEREWEL